MKTLKFITALFALSFSALSLAKQAYIQTNYGEIIIELDEKKAPKTVENFVNYAEQGFYDQTIFHRVIDGFMIQGGGFDSNMQQKSTNTALENEADNGLKNSRGTIAMARKSDPHSASSQFFINLVDNEFLNFTDKTQKGYGYAVFGKVISGMDVVDKIGKLATHRVGMHRNVPTENVVITEIQIK